MNGVKITDEQAEPRLPIRPATLTVLYLRDRHHTPARFLS